MGTDPQGGIMRRGQNGNFSYAVKAGFAKKPVNFVTMYSAMRYCNWLHNGAQPNGDTERGAYRLLGNIPPDTVTIRRNPSARFFLPTEDEWYKAAFYDPSPAGRPTASYWSYADRSDRADAKRINFGGAFKGLTDVHLPGAASFFGTFGQSGNVAEWTEGRVVRGGHFSSAAVPVSSRGSLNNTDPLVLNANTGFRIGADKAWQRIAPFAAITGKTVASAPFRITVPVASSGLRVILRVKSGPAKLTGNEVTVTGAGQVVLSANQAGDENFDPAPEVTTSFTVARLSHSIRPFAVTNNVPFGTVLTFTNTNSTAGLPVSFAVVSGPGVMTNGNQLRVTGSTGSVTVRATVASNANYNAVTPLTNSFTTAKATQTITFTNLLGTYSFKSNTAIPLRATASSGLAVTFTSANTNVLQIVGGTNAVMKRPGTNTITASQSGNENFLPASNVTRTIVIR
jgi:hypothetical protein